MKYNALLFFVFVILYSCKNESTELPILGNQYEENGKVVHHKIRDWSFLNQDSITITNDQLSDNIYIADFFFTSCPSICPKVQREMLAIYKEFEDEPRVKLISFSIDPKRDTVGKLKEYAAKMEIDNSKWYMLTGDKDFTLDLAEDYFIVAYEDEEVPGGFDHSGKIILVDGNGHVRSFSEGTDETTTPKLINDIKTLLKE